MEIHIEDDIPLSSQLQPSSPPSSRDFVKWQGSQTTCQALSNLIMEASTSIPRRRSPRHIKRNLIWDTPSASSSSSSSISAPSVPKPSLRTRPRPSRHSDAHANPTPFPATTNNPLKKDPAQFLDILKDISEQADENTRRKKRYLAPASASSPPISLGGVAKATAKGKAKARGGVRENLGRRVSSPLNLDVGKGMETDVENDHDGHHSVSTSISHRSLPNLDPPSFSFANSSASTSSAAMCIDSPARSHMDVDVDNSPLTSYDTRSMFMDVDIPMPTSTPPPIITPAPPPKRNHTHMPPPPVPAPKSNLSQVAPKSTPLAPAPKLHPLILQPPQKAFPPRLPLPLQPPIPALFPLPSQLQPPRPAPPLTQHTTTSITTSSTRLPPPLGMRRAHTHIPTSNPTKPRSTPSPFTPSQTLPAKQKGFKVPLLSNSQGQVRGRGDTLQTANPTRAPAPGSLPPREPPPPIREQSQPQISVQVPTPSPSPHSTEAQGQTKAPTHAQGRSEGGNSRASSPFEVEGDSFGDMSFDMDALEETMRKYD